MACRTVLRSVFLTEPWRPFHHNASSVCSSFSTRKSSTSTLKHAGFCTVRARDFNCTRRIHHAYSSNYETPKSSSFFEDDQCPPQEVVLKAISEVSKTEGRIGQTTNMVIGGTVTDDASNEWLTLDQKVNSYPTVREFTAIGTGGDDFVLSMVGAVESIIQEQIPQGCVKQKVSSGGKYISVNIGPVEVISSEQVQAVYNAMRRDDRMKYFL